jgi:serine/threonine-protein kinase RsbW/stage II sporulation protein AB (anti-sigma F factor)
MVSRLQVRANASPECVRPLRNAVASLASEVGLSSGRVYAVKLCVSEAVTNAVLHAYPERDPGPIDVSAREVGDELVVTVADRGRGRVTSPTHSDGEGGFGLAFISRLTDGCTFTATRDGTTIEMLFLLPRRTSQAGAGWSLRGPVVRARGVRVGPASSR